MKLENNRAFKEWAVSCEALTEGKQILLIRKGGIREEGGAFRIEDPEFFLLPTYEHQNARLLQTPFVSRLEALKKEERDPGIVTLNAYAVVEDILLARDEAQVNAVANATVWNEIYVKERFNFNPYDPLYLLILRVYRLTEAIALPLLPAYGGCKSWVTLKRAISTRNAIPAIPDAEFAARRNKILHKLTRKDTEKGEGKR